MADIFKKGSIGKFSKLSVGNKVDKLAKGTIPKLNRNISGHRKTRMPKPPVIKFKKFKV